MKAIARGCQSSDDLHASPVESVAVTAEREGVLANYVRRLTRLAFLASKIAEAIAAGHRPPELTARANRTSSPVERAGTSGRNRLVRAEFASVFTRELAFTFQGHYDQIARPASARPVLEGRTRKPSLSNGPRTHLL
jgi:hypothetical protein